MPDKAGLEHHKPTSLEGIALTASLHKTHRFRNLYRELTPELLLSAWIGINKDAASGVDKMTAMQYRMNLLSNIEDLAQRLKEKRYKAKLVKRTYIPKDNGKERPLGMPITVSYYTSFKVCFDCCEQNVYVTLYIII